MVKASTFTLTLPLHYGQEEIPASVIREEGPISTGQPATNCHPPRLSPLILAIDDNPDVVAILKENLGDAGYEVVGAETGLRRAGQGKGSYGRRRSPSILSCLTVTAGRCCMI